MLAQAQGFTRDCNFKHPLRHRQHQNNKPRPRSGQSCPILLTALLAAVAMVCVAVGGCGGGGSSSASGTSTTTTTTTSTGTTTTTPSGSSIPGVTGDGVWLRNAVYAEVETFDPCNAHQPQSGEYHYHDNPACLRFQLNDNIQKLGTSDLDPQYTEITTGNHHSPILGWAYDGYPIYGPYGYSNPTNASSPVRRMVSSYSLRSITTRQTLPQWAATAQGFSSTTLASGQYGPAVNSTYPLGRYVEDYDYVAGSGDLDQYNGRMTVTPDFPNGTYAYFVTIDSTGAPAFPYVLGLQYYGAVSGGAFTSVNEATTVSFSNHAQVGAASSVAAVNSWFTKNSAQYVQVISGANTAAGAQTTWPGTTTPQYADVQEVQYSSNYVYVNAPDLASHIMGPWYLSPGVVFPNWPSNQNAQSRFPLAPSAASSKTTNGLGALGRWVNGVSVFNMLDGHSWSNSAQADE